MIFMKYSYRRNSFIPDMYGMKVHYYNNTHTESIPMSFGINYWLKSIKQRIYIVHVVSWNLLHQQVR